MNIFTKNMFLGKSGDIQLRFLYSSIHHSWGSYSVLRASRQAKWSVDSDVRKAQQGRNRCSRDCGGVDWSTSSLVERFICSFSRKPSSSSPLPTFEHLPLKQYALVNFFMFYRSGHGVFRMFFLHVQAFVRDIGWNSGSYSSMISSIMSSHSSFLGSLWQTSGSLSASSSTCFRLKASSFLELNQSWVSVVLCGWGADIDDFVRLTGSTSPSSGST
jgi:hypothetical protein